MNEFPKDFIWGAACSSYQSEGAWDADGKGPSIWDDFTHFTGHGHVVNDENADIACDSYHRYAEDVALMKKIGLKAFRLSISWPRIFPNGTGEVNAAGLDYYDRFVDELIKSGIEPMLTLYHWDLPSALQEKGGWLNRDTVDAFAAYASIIGSHFDGRVKTYMPINEPQCVVHCGHNNLEHAPGIKLDNLGLLKTYHHLALAQSAAANALREASHTPILVGTAMCGRICYPETPNKVNTDAAYKAMFRLSENDWAFTYTVAADPMLLKKYPDDAPDVVKAFEKTIPQSDWDMMATFDFFGANIYNATPVDGCGNPVGFYTGYPQTALKWAISEESMEYGIRFLYQRYGLPIIITENGLSCNDRIFLDGSVHDPNRIDFLSRYLSAMKRAMDAGAEVKGYMHWSFLDNFEWAKGYSERFGLVYVDYPSQKRILKESALWYADVIASNGKGL